MKKRIENHKGRCEVIQYDKLIKRYDTFSWGAIGTEITVKYPEFNRRYKKLMGNLYDRKFRSSGRAMRYDDACWNSGKGYGEI